MQTDDHGGAGRSIDPVGGLTHDDVSRLLEILEHSTFDYLEIEVAGTRLVAGKSGWQAAGPLPAPTPIPAPTAAEAESADRVEPAPSTEGAADGVDLVTVTAPIVGVFYRAPRPGAEPYVSVGSFVEAEQTLGLIEVMKMFSGVTASQAGDIVELLVADGEFVEFGQPLMTLRPVGG